MSPWPSIMQSMGEGQGCDRRGWISLSFCQPYLPKGHCAELGSRLGEGREWSLNYASFRRSRSLDTPGSPNSGSATRFSVCWWFPPGGCRGGVWAGSTPHPFHSSSQVLLPEMLEACGKATHYIVSHSCSNSSISMPSCLSGCLGGSVERPGHLSKSWALTLSTRHCLGPYFVLRKGRFPFSPDWGWRGCLHTERRPKTWEW